MLVLVFGVAASRMTASQPAIAAEYQVKAVFLFNFAQFAEWPPKSFSDGKAPIVIGIYGQDPFGEYLDNLVRDETVGGRAFIVRRIRQSDEIRDCHILFISRSEQQSVEKVLARVRGAGVLTISDTERFTYWGGMVNFVMDGGKVRLRVNAAAAKAAGLILSSKILRHATIVSTGKD